MKTYLLDVIPKLKEFSQKLDNKAFLCNKHWILLSGTSQKVVYIFRENGQLLISQNGAVSKCSYELLTSSSILIEQEEVSRMFQHGFLDNKVLALRLDGTQEYAVFFDEKAFGWNENLLQQLLGYLKNRYLLMPSDNNKSKESYNGLVVAAIGVIAAIVLVFILFALS